MYNKLLNTQLEQLLGKGYKIPAEMLPMLQVISNTYDRACPQELVSNKSEAEANLYSLFENTHDCIWSIDTEFCLLTFNSAFIKSFQIYSGNLIKQGDRILEFLPEYDKAKWKLYYERALSGERFEVEEVSGKDEDLLYFDISFNPIVTDNKIAGVSVFLKNVSDKKKAEREVIKAKDAAVAATSAKSDFLATMSHEIRTPLNGIIGMAGLLDDTPLNDEQKDYVNTIKLSGDTLLTLINDILDFSKIESGKLDLEEISFELRTCIEEAFDLLAPKAFEKKIDLLYLIEPDVPAFIIGDITRIRQIFVNLISNAIKFTEYGEVFVHVAKTSVENNLTSLTFSVRDTGIGIPSERLDKLFQAFSQIDASTTRKYGGTGLGLAICKRLVEIMGGTIRAESRKGEGSTFIFTLKVKSSEQLPRVYLKGNIPELVDKKILIVDDNHTNLKILNEHCRQWGMSTFITSNPAEALKWIKSNINFDAAIIDMIMPGMNGLELGMEIRKMRSKNELPAVLLSSTMKQDDLNITEVFNSQIAKPLKQALLYELLLKLFSQRQEEQKLKKVKPQQDKISERLPLQILIAEDNTINQKLILSILCKLGYNADAVNNGLEVLKILKEKRYDVIFMDIQMPEMDGLTATETILEEYGSCYKPVIIAMTANAMPGDREICFAAGMRDYITKPISFETVKSVLNNWGEAVNNAKETGSELTGNGAIDFSAVNRLRELDEDGGPTFLNMMIELFLQDTPSSIDIIKKVTIEKNFTEMSAAAHGLKGIALNIGAKLLSNACLKIEIKGRNEDGEGLDNLLKSLDEAYGLTCKELKKLIK